MNSPLGETDFRYTMRADTRPEGREAVDRVTVSGTGTFWVWAVLNQVLNWVMGEGERCERERAPFWNWAARGGVVVGWGEGSLLVVVVEGGAGFWEEVVVVEEEEDAM